MSQSDQSDQLAESLDTRHVVMIALGGAIGAGLFIGASAAIHMAGPAVIVSYVLAGTLIWLVNMMLRDLAIKVPGDKSFLGQIRYALGERVAFVTGWIYWITWVIVIGAETIAVTNMIADYLPLPYVGVELLILGVMTGVNLFSVKGYGEFEYWLSTVKVVAIILFIVICGWALGFRAPPVQENLVAHGGLIPHGWMALLAVVPTIVFSMGGSEIATVAAVESADTTDNISRATKTIPMRLGLFYIVSISLILCLVPWTSVVSGHSPFLLVLKKYHVPFAETSMMIVILTAALSSLNSGIFVTSRILYELADHKEGPAFFLAIDPKTQLPRRALLMSVGVAVLVALTAYASPDTVFSILLSLTGGFMLFYNSLLIIGRLKVVPEKPAGAYLALLLIGVSIFGMCIHAETRSQIEMAVGAIVITMLAERFIPRESKPPSQKKKKAS
ncbi:amino acid permease [Swingsia samuiensis]|uniref:Amino acid permease n=1 Tax=Swingsia samuiensis TaxID=1293412 RepID=A0A4Y6UG34_9PROT|nr:amino acid permease [Swingsia samuiensis]QDH16532.1 amino acid permease [Swingsia samuiensis]